MSFLGVVSISKTNPTPLVSNDLTTMTSNTRQMTITAINDISNYPPSVTSRISHAISGGIGQIRPFPPLIGRPRRVLNPSDNGTCVLLLLDTMLLGVAGQHQRQGTVAGHVARRAEAVLQGENRQHQRGAICVEAENAGDQAQ